MDYTPRTPAIPIPILTLGDLRLETSSAEITEGAGSIAVELFAEDAIFDHFVAPLGNGALLNGCARWIKAASPMAVVVGVCAINALSMLQSFNAKRGVETESANTIADGIAVRVPIERAVSDMQGLVA